MISVDLAVVGAGPAGMSAAISAVEAGARVMMIDEAMREGGQIYRQPAPGANVPPVGVESEIARKKVLLADFNRLRDRIDIRFGTIAHSLFPDNELQIGTEQESARVQAGAVVLATGVSERAVPFPGWTLPGVTYAGAAQALLKAHGVMTGKRIVIAGLGALPIAVGGQLAKMGADVAAVALLHPLLLTARDPIGLLAGWRIVREGLKYRRWLKKAGVPLLEGWAPVEARGGDRVEGITLAPVNADGSLDRSRQRSFDVDAVGLNYGFNVNSELARMAGVACDYVPLLGGWLPQRDETGHTGVGNIYVAGDGAELRGALVAAADGRIAGAHAAARALGHAVPDLRGYERIRRQNTRFQQALRPTLELPNGAWSWAEADTVVCRCEAVTRGRIEQAARDGHLTLDAIKRNTRVGMGWCGGRSCLQAACAIARISDAEMSQGPMRARPVARPVRLGALANLTTEE